MRKFTPPEDWDRHLAVQAASGKSVKCYCRANDLDVSSFYRQRRKHSNNDGGAQSGAFVLAGAFRSPNMSGSSLSIRLKDVTLTLDPGYSSEDLEAILATLAKVRDVLCPE
jgi:hypothetical protein